MLSRPPRKATWVYSSSLPHSPSSPLLDPLFATRLEHLTDLVLTLAERDATGRVAESNPPFEPPCLSLTSSVSLAPLAAQRLLELSDS